MTPHPQPTTRTRITRATLFLALCGALFFLAMPGSAKPGDPAGDDAVITVEFADDDMGFNVTSSKDISNVIVVLCDGTDHKHEPALESHFFNHTEEQEITGVYVKSGNNGIEGNEPEGAGEFFANEGVDCSETTTSTSSTDTSTSDTDTETSGSETETETTGSETDTETSGSETETETTGSETDTETSGSETDSETTGSDTETETEQIPVFGTATTVALAIGGALGGALLMLRRKL